MHDHLNPRSPKSKVHKNRDFTVSTPQPWPMEVLRSAGFKNPLHLAKLRESRNVFYTHSTCQFSTDRHSFTDHCTCAPPLVLNPRIHVNQFILSSYPRPLGPLPPSCNLLEGGFTFVALSFNNAILCFLPGGPFMDATRAFPTTTASVLR